MENRRCEHAERLIAYLAGETGDPDYAWMERHLACCPACQAEYRELEQVWRTLPFEMEEMDVPPDLKSEVLHAVFQADAGAPGAEPANRTSRWQRVLASWRAARLPVYRTAVALLLVLLGYAGWENHQLRLQMEAAATPPAVPAQVVQVLQLVPADPAMASAKGYVWVLRQGERKVLVFQVRDLRATQGTEAYQAWLIQNGKRTNAGVFVTDQHGNGVLTYEWDDRRVAFDGIGITLEPDSQGNQPRGKKVLGTKL